MLKRSLKAAIGVSAGAAIGAVVLPRLFYPERYGESYPPLWVHALYSFAVLYCVCFVVLLLINLARQRLK